METTTVGTGIKFRRRPNANGTAVFTVPNALAEILEAKGEDLFFDVSYDETGIHYTPAVAQEAPVELPKPAWL